MSFNAENEINRLWRGLHGARDEIGRTYYRWRQAALEAAGPDAKPLDVSLRAAEIMGTEIGKAFLPRLNWLKGEEGFMMNLGRSLAGLWITEGGIAFAEKGENPGEIFVKCTRCPWPTAAKQYGVPMEEVALTRERLFQTMIEDVSFFLNIKVKIEMLKAIPRGQGEWLFRLYKEE